MHRMPATLLLLGFACCSPWLKAQCTSTWQPSGGLAGTDGPVDCLAAWDPDGSGPQGPRVVVGGRFTVAGNTIANHVVTWDPQTGSWAALGGGVANATTSPSVRAATALGNGDLVIAGQFSHAGGALVDNIARWNGAAWTDLALGANWIVNDLTVLPNGDLIASGQFSQIGGTPAPGIARWDGSSWQPLGGGLTSSNVEALAVMPNGDLLASGRFTFAGGTQTNVVMRWDGTTWSTLGGSFNSRALAIAALPTGEIIAGGNFTQVGGTAALGCASWDGTSWSPLGAPGWVTGLAQWPGGVLIACGNNVAGSDHVAIWTGSNWIPLGNGPPTTCQTIAVMPNADLVAAGTFTNVGGQPAHRLARLSGAGWGPLGSLPSWDAPITAFVTMQNGDLIAGGAFTSAAGVPCTYLARKRGATWSAIGGGPTSPVTCLARTATDELVVGADNGISVWNGVSWQHLGIPAGSTATTTTAVAQAATGEIFATFRAFGSSAGTTYWIDELARWTGTAWSSVYGPSSSLGVGVLHTSPSGTLYAGFNSPLQPSLYGYAAAWTGSAWQQLGPIQFNSGAVTSLTTLPGGQLVKCQGGTVSRWNGTAWLPMQGPPSSYAASLLPDGDLAVAGSSVARWNGTNWTSLATGLTSSTGGAWTRAITFDPEGAILVSGPFTRVDGIVAVNAARYQTSCPTTVTTHAPGCATSVGNAQWNVDTAPWAGATYRATWSNLPPLSFAVDVIGIATNPIPLATLLPGPGGSGCMLMPTTNFVELRPLANGRITTTLAIPELPGLAGFPFFQQLVPFEFDAAQNLIGVTGTDTIRLTIGLY